MIKIGDFVSARLVERRQESLSSGVNQKEGIYLRKRPNTVTIDLLDADTLAKLHSGEIKELKSEMLHECWLHRAKPIQSQTLLHVTKEQIATLRAALR